MSLLTDYVGKPARLWQDGAFPLPCDALAPGRGWVVRIMVCWQSDL